MYARLIKIATLEILAETANKTAKDLLDAADKMVEAGWDKKSIQSTIDAANFHIDKMIDLGLKIDFEMEMEDAWKEFSNSLMKA